MTTMLAEVVVVDAGLAAGCSTAFATDSSSVSPYMAYSSCTCDSCAGCMNRCAKISSNISSTGRAFLPNAVACVPSACERD